MRLTEKGMAYLEGRELTEETPQLAEYCLYGTHYNEYIFACAYSAEDMLVKFQRPPDGYSRVVKTIEGMHHTHAGDGECIPSYSMYNSAAGRRARNVVYRSIASGNQNVHL